MFLRLIEKIATTLGELGLPYMIIGGQAVLLYGEPRLTKDIDITLGVGPEALGEVKKAVSLLNLSALVNDVDDFVKQTMVFPVLDETSGIRVDFIFSFSSYERQAIKRAVKVKVGEAMVRFASLEDVIIHKIVSGRPRDIEDIKAIIVKNPGFDRRYIAKWLEKFDESLIENFSEAFQKILGEQGLDP